jgi:thymidylate synthase ThyX
LGGVHLACEGASNLLTKVLEWGRLASYLEQSTRYVPYTSREDGRWRYHLPAELVGTPHEAVFRATLDGAFETYTQWLTRMEEHFRGTMPAAEGESPTAHARAVRARALDAVRGFLPVATQSNVGIYASGQAYEALLLRMRAHPLREVRDYASRMLGELRAVIPAFLRRVDQPDRGQLWTDYLAQTRRETQRVADDLLRDVEPRLESEVVLSDFDPEGEVKLVAAALYPVSRLADRQLLELAREMSTEVRARVLAAYVGRRGNRRHKPGRAFERIGYRFDVLGDYGAFRDLQRHRLLTVEWQPLSTHHGYATAPELVEAGGAAEWQRTMEASAKLYERLVAAGLPEVAPYAISMAYRIRYYLDMNAREAMHLIELRSAPQGHPGYRRIAQEMHRQIAEVAGHRAVAAAMSFVDHDAGETGRLEAERAAERRREST